MSRGGYRKLERQMMQEELEKMKEAAESDPSVVIQPPAPPPRHKKWKAGRIKAGKYINPTVAEVAARIDDLDEQSSQGSFNPSRRMDILSTAIGKADDLGRVRGETRGVSAARYFGRDPRYSSQAGPSKDVVAKIREELEREIEANLRDKLRQELLPELQLEMAKMFEAQRARDEHRTQESPAFNSTRGSYNPLEQPLGAPSPTPVSGPLGDPSPTPVSGDPSTLYLDDPLLRVVADALVHTRATTHHNQQIPEDFHRVNVTSVRKGEEGTTIPVPDPEVRTLGQAIGSFILWPHNLIGSDATPPMDDEAASKWPFLARLQQIYKGIKQIDLKMPPGIVGQVEYPYTIDNKDLKQFIRLEEIDAGWVKFAVRYVKIDKFNYEVEITTIIQRTQYDSSARKHELPEL